MTNKNYYQTLGINQNASSEQIKKSYRLYASKFHPDKHKGDNFFEEKFKEIQEAYDVLSDSEKRKVYDNEFFNFNKVETQEPTTEKENFYTKNNNTAYNQKSKPKTEKQQKRSKNILIGIGTAFLFFIIMEIGGKSGFHVPIAMIFFFWTIRQIFVIIVSFLPD